MDIEQKGRLSHAPYFRYHPSRFYPDYMLYFKWHSVGADIIRPRKEAISIILSMLS